MSRLALRLFCLAIALASLASGCTTAGPGKVAMGSGLKAWIDAPLDGSTIPLAPYDVVSHGTDPSGVSQVELSINGVVSNTGSAPGHTLVTMRQKWMPPGPGNYTIMVRAQAGGGWSDYAKVVVTVAGATPTITPSTTRSASPSPTPTLSLAATRTATGTPTATPPSPPPAGLTFTAEPDTIDAGQCSILRWKTESAAQVLLDNRPAEAEGSQQECPRSTTPHILLVTAPDGNSTQHSVTITVRPPTVTPAPGSITAVPVDPSTIVEPELPLEMTATGTATPGPSSTSAPATRTATPPPTDTPPPATPTHTPPPPPVTPSLTPPPRVIVPTATLPAIRRLPTATPTRKPEIIR